MSLISIRRPKLRLQAMRGYRAPRYPRADQALDFDLEDVALWPFSPALASALLASTLLVAAAPPAHAGDAQARIAATRPQETVSLPNPFGPQQRVIDFGGKGGPMTMPREMALVAIAKGFAESGIDLKMDVPYRKAGVRALMDGLDAKKAIGFEWVGRYDGGTEQERLDHKEVARLDKDAALGRRQIAVIYEGDARFTGDPAQAAANLTRAVQEYVDYLRSVGAL